MRKFLTFVLVLGLLLSFATSIFYYSMNLELREDNQTAVFSFKKWLSAFSNFSVPELSFTDIWSRNNYSFTYYKGTAIPFDHVKNVVNYYDPVTGEYVDNFENIFLVGAWVQNNNEWVLADSVVFYDMPTYDANYVVLFRIYGTERYNFLYGRYVCSYECSHDVEYTVDLSESSGFESFFARVRDTFSLIGAYISSIFNTVTGLMPWNTYDVISIGG